MTTLVCILSDQHVPNLLTVKAIRPDHLVLIVTNRMKKNTPWFLSALAFGGLDYSQKSTVIEIQKEHSFDEIISSLKAEYAKDPDKKWILNITGGTKPMSIGAYMFAQENRLKALYVVESDQQNAIDLSGGDSLSLSDQHVTTAEFLAGYGYPILNLRSLGKLDKRAGDWAELGALLTAHYDDPDLLNCLKKLQGMKTGKKEGESSNWEKVGFVLTMEDRIGIWNPEIRKGIAGTFGLSENKSILTGHLDRHAIEFLTGKWLEFFVYGLLRPLEPTYVRCLHSSLSFGLPGSGQNNELDVSFMADRSFCMVECKTGSQRQDPEGEHVIYKTEAIKKGSGALRVRAYIASTASNVNEKTGKIPEKIVNRSDLYGCPLFEGKTLKELARMYLVRDPSLNDRVIGLFKLKASVGSP